MIDSKENRMMRQIAHAFLDQSDGGGREREKTHAFEVTNSVK